MSITLLIIIITVIVSLIAFNNQDVMNKCIFYPPAITNNNQWYRFITSGFIHADYAHLFFNMYSFYSFGMMVESAFGELFGFKARALYLLFYLSALIVSSIPTYLKNKDNSFYQSLGASGAVSAIVFASMVLDPTSKIQLMFIPIGIPAVLFGIVFLFISAWLDKRGGGHINHSAHLFGALYGVVFMVVSCYLFSNYPVIQAFMENIKAYLGGELTR